MCDTPIRWEYAQLYLHRDTMAPTSPWPRTRRWTGPDGAEQDLGAETVLAALNRLGAEGWELVGPPEVENVTSVLRNGTGGERTAALWTAKTFWLRRAVPPHIPACVGGPG